MLKESNSFTQKKNYKNVYFSIISTQKQFTELI